MTKTPDEYFSDEHRSLPSALAALPTVSSTMTILVGALVLAGWTLDIELLKRGVPGFVAMNPLTAVAFVLAGTALLKCRERDHSLPSRTVKIIAGVVLLIGAAKIVGLIFGWRPGVDELLFASKLNPPVATEVNRMAPNTAVALSFVGLSLLAVDFRVVRFSLCQIFALAVAFCALLSLTGYAYGVKEFYGLATFIPMALHTAVLFLLLAAGLFFSRSATPLSQMFATTEPRGVLARRMFPSAVLLVLVLGWLRLKGEAFGWYEARFGTALFAIALSICFVALIRWTIWTVSQIERERTAMNRALIESKLELQESLRETELIINHARELICTIDDRGKVLTMSVAAEQVLGFRPSFIIGKGFVELHSTDERAKVEAVLKAAQSGLTRGETTTRCPRKDGTFANVVWSLQYSVHYKRTFCVGRETGGASDRSAWSQSS